MKLLSFLISVLQLAPGLWFTDKPVEYKGLTEGDAISFSIPVEEKLQPGTYVQFGVTLENTGSKAPRHYMVEVLQGKKWVCISSPVYKDGLSTYSFVTAASKDNHPSTYLNIFRLQKPVSDSLRVRCRVCSPYAADRSVLSREDPENRVCMREKHYVGARLNPLGKKAPVARKKVLMIGNSFTYFYSVPLLLQEIAFSQGLELDINASLKGGQTFRQHTGLVMTLATSSMDTYDFAFLQGQSQEPAYYATDVSSQRDVKFAFCDLCDAIRTVSPECNIYIENTWAYSSGDWGGFGSRERFEQLLAEGTSKLSIAGRTGITPVGQAFSAVAADSTAVNPLGDDFKHQSLAGSYLKACVEYLIISGKPFRGAVPACGLSGDEAGYLRSIAEKTVFNL